MRRTRLGRRRVTGGAPSPSSSTGRVRSPRRDTSIGPLRQTGRLDLALNKRPGRAGNAPRTEAQTTGGEPTGERSLRNPVSVNTNGSRERGPSRGGSRLPIGLCHFRSNFLPSQGAKGTIFLQTNNAFRGLPPRVTMSHRVPPTFPGPSVFRKPGF